MTSEQDKYLPFERIEGVSGKRDPRTHAYRRKSRKRHRTPEQQARWERLSGLRPPTERPVAPPPSPPQMLVWFDVKRLVAPAIAFLLSFINGTSTK